MPLKSGDKFEYCHTSAIRACVMGRKYEGCHQCDESPCKLIDDFPFPIGKKVILRSVSYRKKLGSEKWAEAEENRYKCPNCGGQLFRGVKQCGSCKKSVEVG